MSHSTELATIGGLDDYSVTQAEEALSAIATIETPRALIRIVERKLEGGEIEDAGEASRLLIANLIQLHQFSRRSNRSIADLIESSRRSVDTEEGPANELHLVERGLKTLERLSSIRSVGLAARAIDLSYDSDNLLQRTRVVTDIRPLFSGDAMSVDGAIVGHTLRLRYDHEGRDEELSLAVDVNDLEQLRQQCERAILKDSTAKTSLIEKSGVPTTQAAEDTNARD